MRGDGDDEPLPITRFSVMPHRKQKYRIMPIDAYKALPSVKPAPDTDSIA